MQNSRPTPEFTRDSIDYCFRASIIHFRPDPKRIFRNLPPPGDLSELKTQPDDGLRITRTRPWLGPGSLRRWKGEPTSVLPLNLRLVASFRYYLFGFTQESQTLSSRSPKTWFHDPV